MILCFSSMNLSFNISRNLSLAWILSGTPRLSMLLATFAHGGGRTYNFLRECPFANGVGRHQADDVVEGMVQESDGKLTRFKSKVICMEEDSMRSV